MRRLAVALALSILAAPANSQSLVERGSYLVNTVLTCGNCHTPKGPNGDIAERAFSGGLRFDFPPFDVTASNITPDKETGIGSWTDAEVKRALTEGVRPNGVPLAAVMPSGFLKALTARDLDAVVAYLRSLPAIKNRVPDPIYKAAVPHDVPPGAEKPTAESALADKLQRGFYLVTIAHCMECHTPMTPRGSDYQNSLGKGGRPIPGPWGVSITANVTSHKTAGIGAWSDDEIKRAITQGISRDGRKLKPPMGYSYYAKMTNEDLDAMVAWLRTLPAKE